MFAVVSTLNFNSNKNPSMKIENVRQCKFFNSIFSFVFLRISVRERKDVSKMIKDNWSIKINVVRSHRQVYLLFFSRLILSFHSCSSLLWSFVTLFEAEFNINLSLSSFFSTLRKIEALTINSSSFVFRFDKSFDWRVREIFNVLLFNTKKRRSIDFFFFSWLTTLWMTRIAKTQKQFVHYVMKHFFFLLFLLLFLLFLEWVDLR